MNVRYIERDKCASQYIESAAQSALAALGHQNQATQDGKEAFF